MRITEKNQLTSDKTLEEAKEMLCSFTGAKEVLFTGRAASGLYLALRLIREKRKDIEVPEIILPALSCSTAANCAIMAGYKVRFADVNPQTALPDPETMQALAGPSTIALVFIHLFGNTTHLQQLAAWCKQNNIALVEDLVHSVMPDTANTRCSGTFGDFVIFSFNAPKILSGGGGALCMRDDAAIERIAALLHEPPYKQAAEPALRKQLALGYRHLHHQLVHHDRSGDGFDIHSFFMGIRQAFDALMWLPEVPAGFDPAKQLSGLSENYARRMDKARIYLEALRDVEGISVITSLGPGENCWRFSFCIKQAEKLFDFSEKLRNDGFHVSNLYWPPNRFFNPADACPNANKIARSIVNLWVDDAVSTAEVKACLTSVQKHVNAMEHLSSK
ncbi:MAG: DegT/DnrJ/EryC1/StrS family aminotransferase [Bacteroidia bacterium]|nr:DegT/DnrJ/EryC1/StrS family aminotransferase [Bacteroidia bacterium]